MNTKQELELENLILRVEKEESKNSYFLLGLKVALNKIKITRKKKL